MIVDNIKLDPGQDDIKTLRSLAAKKAGVRTEDIDRLTIKKRSIDARKKPDVRIIYTVECVMRGERQQPEARMRYPRFREAPKLRPVVVGSGPAGMLCGLYLAKAGARPLIIERGSSVERRTQAVERYFATGVLDPRTNVQFGEGGAGTFSDGKLTTGTKDSRIAEVNRVFVEAGADEDIMYSAKPHIGTDTLRSVVRNIRAMIEKYGGEYLFDTQLTDIFTSDDILTHIAVSHDGVIEKIPCECMILACGHSARDTFEMLLSRGVHFEQKPFSIGARIEHPQPLIDRIQFGYAAGIPALGAADYKLAVRTAEGRGVYTFCMCPGGYVVAAASEPDSVCTNGMSLRARDGSNANSAVLVGITPDDFGSEHPLAGMYLQRGIERRAYAYSGSAKAPAQLVGDLLAGRASVGGGSVVPTYRPGVAWGSIDCCLPDFIVSSLREGISLFDRRMRGFALPDAVLTAPETRSSSPVRIVRGDDLQCNVRGVYPCGEGAGYAGGIMSAAVDGIKSALAVLADLSEK